MVPYRPDHVGREHQTARDVISPFYFRKRVKTSIYESGPTVKVRPLFVSDSPPLGGRGFSGAVVVAPGLFDAQLPGDLFGQGVLVDHDRGCLVSDERAREIPESVVGRTYVP